MLPTSSFVVLGLLSKISPLSGYDITAFADRSVAHFWSISRTLVYRELARLEELGYVEANHVVQERLPDKRIYAPTPDGLAALDEWLADPTIPLTSAKHGFLVKFFFADRMSHHRVDSLLADYQESTAEQVADLSAIANHLADMPDAIFGLLAARYGVLAAEARLRWLREVEEVLGAHLAGRVPPESRPDQDSHLVSDAD